MKYFFTLILLIGLIGCTPDDKVTGVDEPVLNTNSFEDYVPWWHFNTTTNDLDAG